MINSIYYSGVASNNLYVKDEIGVGWNSWLGALAVSGGSGASNVSLLSDSHLRNGILPALDHSHFSESEGDGLASWDRGVEDLAVGGKSTGVLNLSLLTGGALLALSLFEDVDGDSVVKFGLSQVLRSRVSRGVVSSSLSGSSFFWSDGSLIAQLSGNSVSETSKGVILDSDCTDGSGHNGKLGELHFII